MTRAALTCGVLLLSGLVITGCNQDRSRRSARAVGSTASPSTQGQPTPVTSSSPAPVWSMPAAGPLTPALRREVARAFAPQLRFNAFHNDGNTSPQNRNEDLFPMGLASFFRELASGRARVLTRPSQGAQAGVSEVRSFSAAVSFGSGFLGDFPSKMVGDAPGTAPVYTHLYEDPAGRNLAADGSGELVVWAEYWLFYPQDRAEVDILGFGAFTFFGHRGDWEHTSYRLRVQLGPALTLQGGTVSEGYYYGHGDRYMAGPGELELVDDAGAPSPTGRHPVVYVAQGKHASYPQAGEWRSLTYPHWVTSYTDFFRGNGVRVSCWQVPLLDLDLPAAAPSEFSSPEFQSIVASSPGPALSDWTAYTGRWGQDRLRLWPVQLSLESPAGPRQQSAYGDFGGSAIRWADLKRREPHLKVYRDRGIVIAPASPPPVPIRR